MFLTFIVSSKDGSPAEKRSRTEEELPPSKMQKPNSDASPDVSQVKALFERKRILEQKLKEVNESLAKIDKAIEDRTAVKAAEAQALEAKLEAEAKPTEIPVPVAPPKAKTPKRKPKKTTKKRNNKEISFFCLSCTSKTTTQEIFSSTRVGLIRSFVSWS